MKDIYLISYGVKGIKTLDEWVCLSFYKKTFARNNDFQNYNIKGIYGANGSGKSAIVTSLKILKEIIIDTGFLSNPLNQKQLGELVNKKLRVLEYDIEYLSVSDIKPKIYRYQLKIIRGRTGKYQIGSEKLSYRIATSHSNHCTVVYQVDGGSVVSLLNNEEFSSELREKTQNLLSNASLTSLAVEKIILTKQKNHEGSILRLELIVHFLFAGGMFAYLEKEDEHTDYFLQKMLDYNDEMAESELFNVFAERMNSIWGVKQYLLSPETMIIVKEGIRDFEKQVDQLEAFLKIFKRDLQNITIEKRENKDHYYCNLLLHYEGYVINAEFESTGIKKLIKLFPYIQKMVNGDVVFIDELDSNLHDVYLCALLEYLREYAKGQLCFTSHNIGPMDVLKQNKQAIDFLSADHRIYSWVTNGNYSPSKLYKNGMIEGSPFNVDSLDFLGVFDTEEGE